MRIIARALIVMVLVACGIGVWWMWFGPPIGNVLQGRVAVVAGLAEIAGLAVAVMVLWPRVEARRGPRAITRDQTDAAVEYLARETLQHWREQAKDQRIISPSPVAVAWRWADPEFAAPAEDVLPSVDPPSGPVSLPRPQGRVLTAGVVTELRERLYEHLDPARPRLVLLGDPGAGKTAAMLLLLIDVLDQRRRQERPAEPVPVWLTLGSWNPAATTLQDWVVATLTRDYPGLTAPEHGGPAAVHLLRTGRVALFLDGLDEMPPAVQGTALRVLDRDGQGLRLVLTSRTEEYRSACREGLLHTAAAVRLLPVSPARAETFLLAEQHEPRRAAWQSLARYLRHHPDSVPARALTTPLMLTLARDTYATAGDPRDLLDTSTHPTPADLHHHLLTRFLSLAYPDPAEHEHATGWLSWIATHMGGNRDLRWWDIPAWMPHRRLRLLLGVPAGLPIGVSSGLAIGFLTTFGPVLAVLAGVVIGASFGFSVGHAPQPHGIAVRRPTRPELRGVLAAGLLIAFFVVLAGGLLTDAGLTSVIPLGVAAGLGVGLVVGLPDLWSTPLATTGAATPFTVYRADRHRTLLFGALFGTVFGVSVGIAFTYSTGLGIGLTFAFAATFTGGLGPAVQLAGTQALWALRGRRIRFMPLLRTAQERQVLRQAGTVYQFRHAALQDLLRNHTATTTDTDGAIED